ncbi:hypothetical protein [Microbacterium sp. H1-D42]|nr:hypothetical protein [Microbacterium sp. H1-D42]
MGDISTAVAVFETFGDDGGVLQIATMSGSVAAGCTAALSVAV